ncbi:MAG: YigZ family protein [Flammeovirgaceae bacterium]
MERDFYYTLKKGGEGLYKEKGSKFLAFSYFVDSEEDVKSKLEEIRKKYFDARHFCYAYILGFYQEKFRANDDGEPNNSAGMPILGQIRSKSLTNTLVVVVRYFGGTKLGVSGLIQAYKTAAEEALSKSEIVEKLITVPVKLEFEYILINEVMRIAKKYNLDFSNQSFDENYKIEFQVRKGMYQEVIQKLKEIRGVSIY